MVRYILGFWAAAVAIQLGLSTLQSQVIDTYRWVPNPQCPDQRDLMKNGVAVGAYVISEGKYWEWNAATRTWGVQRQSPIDIPADLRLGGVVQEKLTGGDKYIINGKEATKEQVHEKLGDKRLLDDRKKVRITIVTTKEEGEKIHKLLREQADFKLIEDFSITRVYQTADWHIEHHKVTKTPTIIEQAPCGKVLHRQEDFSGDKAAEECAAALRKGKDGYQPELSPDLRRINPAGPGNFFDLGAILGLCVVGALGIFAMKRRV